MIRGVYIAPTSAKSKKLANYLSIGINLHFLITILIALELNYVSALIDLIGATIAYSAIRKRRLFTTIIIYLYILL